MEPLLSDCCPRCEHARDEPRHDPLEVTIVRAWRRLWRRPVKPALCGSLVMFADVPHDGRTGCRCRHPFHGS